MYSRKYVRLFCTILDFFYASAIKINDHVDFHLNQMLNVFLIVGHFLNNCTQNLNLDEINEN